MNYRAATVRDAPTIAEVHVASWRTTYKGLLPDELLAGLSVAAREEQWRRQAQEAGGATGGVLIVVEEPTFDDRESGALPIVGFASGGPEREPGSGYDGELYAIYLLEEHQGRGVGRELVRRMAASLSEHGITSMRVWVLTGNPAEGFYRRMGGERLGEKSIAIGGIEYQEIAYGWPKIERLL